MSPGSPSLNPQLKATVGKDLSCISSVLNLHNVYNYKAGKTLSE